MGAIFCAEKAEREDFMKRIISILLAAILLATSLVSLSGCTESDMVSYNVSKEADNFNVQRRLTVINARTDNVLLEIEGTFSLDNSQSGELEIIAQTGENEFRKHFVYLTEYTLYVVEDISGANVDKYHFEVNFLPEWGFTVTTTE